MTTHKQIRKENELLGYLLHFVQTQQDNKEVSLYWRCDAENYTHAVDQLRDEVEHCQGEKLLFHELIKCYR